MNVLHKSFLSTGIMLLLAMSAVSQYSGTKKHLRKNRKDPVVIKYGDSLIYARGLYNDSTRVFVGNSDGSIYYLNLATNKKQLICKMPDINEIRDIERTGNQLVAMHSGTDGKLIYVDLNGSMHVQRLPEWNGVFLDGLDFHSERGFLMGDPSDSLFSLFHTVDGGDTWETCEGKLIAAKGEAGFAASGTNVQVLNDSTYVFVSGGMKSRFFKSTDNGKSWKIVELPYYPGESTGPYSMCFATDSIGVLVGGDYKDPDLGMNTCFYTSDGGESWMNAMETVRGYRSCVYYANGVFYASGRNGIDFSLDGGKEWIAFADGPYFSLSSTRTQLIATTKHGRIQLFDLIEP